MKFAVSGVTRQGNLGGVAMLLTVRQEFLRRYPRAEFRLLSISPGSDCAGPPLDGVSIVRAHWLALVMLFLPTSVVLAPLQRVPGVRWVLRRFGYFRALLDCDALIDLSGIAFVDRRGPALIAYNAACCVPALLLGRPVLKLAQSLGPFQTTLNRVVAGWVLRRCALVVARGEASGRHLAELTGQRVSERPDVAFCLEVPAEFHRWAASEVSRSGASRPIMISPSRVLERDCERRGIDLSRVCADLVSALQDQGNAVALLAHSRRAGISKNDDPAVCARIQAALPAARRLSIFQVDDPMRARAIIGQAAVFVGSRYHALVSAYAQAVPSLALSWNEKYADLARLFRCEDHVIPAGQIHADSLTARVMEMLRRRDSISAALSAALPSVRSSAAENFALAERALQNFRR